MIRTSLEGYDAPVETLIVGSGPAGLTVALELARRGHPSLVLESGAAGSEAAHDLSAAEILDPARHDDMSIAVARQLGGTSNLWGGRCIPLDPIDFEPRAFAREARWPLAYEEIAPYYETACRLLSCGAPVFWAAPPAPTDGAFAMTALERASNRPRLQEAHRAILAASPLVEICLNATLVDLEIGADGRATHAVVVAANGTVHRLAAQRIVLAAGGLETTRLLLALQRQHARLFGGPDGPLGRFYMGHIIGEVADIVFTDEACDAAFDFFRDGHGSFVRRRFVPSAALQVRLRLPNICFWPVVPPIADPIHASGALSAVALALTTPGLGTRLVPEAIRRRHIEGTVDRAAHLRNVLRDAPRTARFLTKFVHQRYLSRERVSGYFLRNAARRYGLSYSSEQSPRPDSRVRLSETRDRLGLPRLVVDLRFHEEDAEAVTRAHDALADWLGANRLGRLAYRQPVSETAAAVLARAAHGTHQIGLARMGASAADGVVDRNLATFDVPNLYVASSAAFPTSGQANPTLSIVAFAARLAAHLAGRA